MPKIEISLQGMWDGICRVMAEGEYLGRFDFISTFVHQRNQCVEVVVDVADKTKSELEFSCIGLVAENGYALQHSWAFDDLTRQVLDERSDKRPVCLILITKDSWEKDGITCHGWQTQYLIKYSTSVFTGRPSRSKTTPDRVGSYLNVIRPRVLLEEKRNVKILHIHGAWKEIDKSRKD